MTDQEKQLIEGLASRIHNAPAPEIDREADAVIRNGIGNRPDALYILTQTVLVQEMALNQAKAQIEDLNRKLQERPAAEKSSGSFLGRPAPSQSAPEHPNQPSWWGGQSAAQPPASPPPLPPQGSQPYSQQQPIQPPPPASGGMFSGFLRSAATTAAGVIAGEAAFSALSGIFGHHSGGGFMGGGSGFLGGASGVSPGSETIVNNYYDSPAGQSGSEHSGAGSQFVDPGTNDTDAASADSASADSYDDTTDDTSDDTSADDDSSYDDSSDDSGSYDDGGGSFDV